jgi:predicted enzyme related to lactoylglutathione lyase
MIHDSWSSFSVNDLETAEKFYSEVLGMRVKKLEMGILEMHPPGGLKVWIYPKGDHQPATFTILNFIVDNIDKEADRLNGLGITFERYPGFEADARGIVRSGAGPTIAWFKDPSGNILAIIEEPPTA